MKQQQSSGDGLLDKRPCSSKLRPSVMNVHPMPGTNRIPGNFKQETLKSCVYKKFCSIYKENLNYLDDVSSSTHRTNTAIRNHQDPSQILRELEPYEFLNQNKFHPNIEGQILVLLRNTISNQCNTKFGANILHK